MAGFTEDDQARIAQEALARAQIGRSKAGLGFGSAQAAPVPSHGSDERRRRAASRSRSHSRHKGRSNHQESRARSSRDKRDRSRSRAGTRRRSRSRSKGARHVHRGGRDRHESRRSRSREKHRERERRRSRSRSRHRSRRDSPRRSRSRSRGRGGGHGRGRDRDRDRDRETSGHRTRRAPAPAPAPAPVKAPLTAEQVKAKMQKALNKVSAKDDQLKPSARASSSAAGWARPEMAGASDFFAEDEFQALGGASGSAGAVHARASAIAAVEDEGTETLEEAALKASVKERRRQANAGLGPQGPQDGLRRLQNEVAHNDAIFAPLGAPAPTAHTAASTAATSSDDDSPPHQAAVATAKAGQRAVSLKRPREEDRRARSMTPEPEEDVPLYKRLQKGDKVEARYTEDNQWYEAEIVQVIHAGYPIAKYKVHYQEYGNSEEISWKRIRLLERGAARGHSPPKASAAPAISRDQVPQSVRRKAAQGGAPSGLLNKVPAAPDMTDPSEIINPNLLANSSGNGKASWKDRLAAARANKNNPEAGAGGATGCNGSLGLLPAPNFYGQGGQGSDSDSDNVVSKRDQLDSESKQILSRERQKMSFCLT